LKYGGEKGKRKRLHISLPEKGGGGKRWEARPFSQTKKNDPREKKNRRERVRPPFLPSFLHEKKGEKRP